jgi:hypothetical protein
VAFAAFPGKSLEWSTQIENDNFWLQQPSFRSFAYLVPHRSREPSSLKYFFRKLSKACREARNRNYASRQRVSNPAIKPFFIHRLPVTVYVLEGAFTLEMEDRAPVTVTQGQAMAEPPHVKMTGYNRSNSDSLRVVVFYISDPDTPFLDPMH